MRKQILLLESILRKVIKLFFSVLLILILVNSKSFAKEKWIIDKNISTINFEVPVLFAGNVIGEFKKINGFVEIDLQDKENNKAILSVDIGSVLINYEKYRDLLLSSVFFDFANFPLGVIDTKKFSYKNENELELNVELTIKGISRMTKTKLKIKRFTNEIVQIIGLLSFSRTDFNIGTGNWSNTTILKDKITIEANIFLIKD